MPPDALLSAVLEAVIEQSGIDPAEVGDLVVGNVNQPGAGALGARMAMFVAGLPETTPCMTVNRQCSSGLQAFANVAGSIRAGVTDVGIAAGVESMSTDDMMSAVPTALSDAATDSDLGMECLTPMGARSRPRFPAAASHCQPAGTTSLCGLSSWRWPRHHLGERRKGIRHHAVTPASPLSCLSRFGGWGDWGFFSR